MLSKRVSGTRFDEAWPNFTNTQRLQVADNIAKPTKFLSAFTSEYIESVASGAIVGKHQLRLREDLPLYKSRLEPSVSQEEYRAFLERMLY